MQLKVRNIEKEQNGISLMTEPLQWREEIYRLGPFMAGPALIFVS